MNVLVTGAAGYIGSHAVACLARAGHRVVALDNLSRGHEDAVRSGVPLVRADVRETEVLERTLREHRIECVMHFAAMAYVGESVTDPLAYYDNNTGGTLSVLRAMDRGGVQRLVFSSTCATYGEPDVVPITEDQAQRPVNPYGWSKLFSERMIRDYGARTPGFAFALLRYFNVAGAARDGSLGERHEPEPHLIPRLLRVASGALPHASVFGTDYPTPDGTCVRDYIHVEDLVDAHVAVMTALAPGEGRVYNLGIGKGYSVYEIIEAARRVTGASIPVKTDARRPGDPAVLFADPARIARELRWKAQTTSIDEIIATAWAYARKSG
jgi:UDP-glucose 4-epimerase